MTSLSFSVAGELKSLSLPRGFPPEITVKEDDEGKERFDQTRLIANFINGYVLFHLKREILLR